MKSLKFVLCLIIGVGLAFAAGCDDSSSSGSDSSSSTSTGTLSVYMTDAPANSLEAVYVTIDEVAVHKAEEEASGDNGEQGSRGEDGDWQVVASPQKTFNLLELVNGAMAELGTSELEAGHYTQMRLMLGENPDSGLNINNDTHQHANYVIKKDGTEQKELFIPSGYQTGIKLVHGFEVAAEQPTELLLDFDASRSVVLRGNEVSNSNEASNNGYLLKPTIKILESGSYPMVQGMVTDDDDEAPESLPDVWVSAQRMDSDGSPEIITSTLTADEEGEAGAYQMYLPTGTYYIVAYKKNEDATAYGPACDIIEAAEPNAVYGVDFSLGSSETGDIQVDVVLPEDSGTATIRILKTAPCSDGGEQIVIVSESIEGSDKYSFSVPGSETGVDYTVETVYGDTIKSEDVEVDTISGAAAQAGFTFQ